MSDASAFSGVSPAGAEWGQLGVCLHATLDVRGVAGLLCVARWEMHTNAHTLPGRRRLPDAAGATGGLIDGLGAATDAMAAIAGLLIEHRPELVDRERLTDATEALLASSGAFREAAA